MSECNVTFALRAQMFPVVAMVCGALIVAPKADRVARPLALIEAKPLNALATLIEMKHWHLVTDLPHLSASQRRREGRERIERIGIFSALPADWTEYTDTCDWIEKNYFLERIGSRIEVVLDDPDRVADLRPYVGARRKRVDEVRRLLEPHRALNPAIPRRRFAGLARKWRGWAPKIAAASLPSFEYCEREGGQTAWQLAVTLGVDDSVSPIVGSTARDGDPVARMTRCVEETMSRWFAGTVRSVPLHYTIRVW